jgi:hypothetical protein
MRTAVLTLRLDLITSDRAMLGGRRPASLALDLSRTTDEAVAASPE